MTDAIAKPHRGKVIAKLEMNTFILKRTAGGLHWIEMQETLGHGQIKADLFLAQASNLLETGAATSPRSSGVFVAIYFAWRAQISLAILKA